MKSEKNEIIICQTRDGQTKIDVRMEDKTLWLTASADGAVVRAETFCYHKASPEYLCGGRT